MEMIWWLSAFFALAAIIAIVWFSSLSVLIEYGHRLDDDKIFIQIRVWGIICYTVKIPEVKVDWKKPGVVYEKETKHAEQERNITPDVLEQRIEDVKKIAERVIGLKAIAGKFIRNVQLRKFEWHTAIGLHDAAWTGIVAGSIWAVKGGILSLITTHLRVKTDPVLSVTPFFQYPISETQLKCMVKVQIGKAIIAAFKMLKYWRGGKAEIALTPVSEPENGRHA
ncbi:DUF2953 domain-containing protein [Heyndrickxia coagulans]|uniref:DUF2953 domain-containing protein n=1 Tax=Heyndrickxia coagulans TaxID=1398 RepID=UPI001F16ABE9|nr:DUF2953 domain-containing protein [Heyndrickxia coagulans]UJZ86607.1 DUF2953 domain-containing protein [Heyndrickxia coagulans]